MLLVLVARRCQLLLLVTNLLLFLEKPFFPSVEFKENKFTSSCVCSLEANTGLARSSLSCLQPYIQKKASSTCHSDPRFHPGAFPSAVDILQGTDPFFQWETHPQTVRDLCLNSPEWRHVGETSRTREEMPVVGISCSPGSRYTWCWDELLDFWFQELTYYHFLLKGFD